MSDLISRQAAIDGKIYIQRSDGAEIYDDYAVPVGYLKQLPSAQPEIIRCKDCNHYNAGFECLIEGYGIERDKEWFCGSAERRTDERFNQQTGRIEVN